MNLKRYLTIYAALWKNSVAREMSFKGNFILWIVSGTALVRVAIEFCLHHLFADRLHRLVDEMADEGAAGRREQFHQAGPHQAFFLTNCTNLSELVRTGRMDFLLALPINTRFIVSLRQVDLGSFVNALFAVCVMIFAAGKLELHPTARQVAKLRRAVRGGNFNPLLADIRARFDFVSGPCAHRASCGAITRCSTSRDCRTKCSRARSRRYSPSRCRFCSLLQRAGARAGGKTGFAGNQYCCCSVWGSRGPWLPEWFWKFSLSHYTSASS